MGKNKSKKIDRTERTVLSVKFFNWLQQILFYMFGTIFFIILATNFRMLMPPAGTYLLGFICMGMLVIPFIINCLNSAIILIGFSERYFWVFWVSFWFFSFVISGGVAIKSNASKIASFASMGDKLMNCAQDNLKQGIESSIQEGVQNVVK